MKEKLRKPLTALMMAWGTYLAIPCPYKVWDDALRPCRTVSLNTFRSQRDGPQPVMPSSPGKKKYYT